MEGSAGPKLPRGGAAARRYGASTTLRKPPTSSGEACPWRSTSERLLLIERSLTRHVRQDRVADDSAMLSAQRAAARAAAHTGR